MIRSIHLILSLLFAFSLSACSIDPRSSEERARSSFEDRHFLDTRIHLANAIAENPEDPALRSLLGQTALALGDGQVAEAAFKKAIEKDDVLASEINPYLAHAYLQQQRPKDALNLIGKIEDSNPYSLRLLAQARLQNGDMPEAWNAIEKALTVDPKNGDILALAGQYQLAVGNIDEAKRYADRSLASPTPSVEAYLLQGRIHSIQGNLDKALTEYEAGAKHFRDHVSIYISQAAIYADLRETEKMEAAIANVERISPGHQSAIYIMARYSLIQGDTDKAYELAQTLEGASQNNPPLLMLLGEVQINRDNLQQAISHLRAYLRLSPNDPAASHLLAKTLEKSGNHQDAFAVIKGAVTRAYSPKPFVDYAASLAKQTNDPSLSILKRRANTPALSKIKAQLARVQTASNNGEWLTATKIYDPLIAGDFSNHPMLLNNAAMAHLRQDNGDRALELVERAYELTPNDPSVLDSLGWIRLNVAEDRSGGLQILKRAFQLAPGNMQIRLHLAQALALNGRKSEARTHIERVMAVVDRKYHKEFDRILAIL
ncbi:MAG: tetratricopeptide repeat protein [Parasphingorhabdus sp.]